MTKFILWLQNTYPDIHTDMHGGGGECVREYMNSEVFHLMWSVWQARGEIDIGILNNSSSLVTKANIIAEMDDLGKP